MKRLINLRLSIAFMILMSFTTVFFQNCAQGKLEITDLKALDKPIIIEIPQLNSTNLSIEGIPEGYTNQSSTIVEHSFSSSKDQSLVEVICKFNNVEYKPCPEQLPLAHQIQGLQNFNFKVLLKATLTVLMERNFSWGYDSINPELEFNTSIPGTTSQSSENIVFTFSDGHSGIKETRCSLNQSDFQACTSPLQLSNLTEGQQTLVIETIDNAGNIFSRNLSWKIDLTPPDFEITIKPEPYTQADTADFEFTSSEDLQYQCNLDGNLYSACASSFKLQNIAEGTHTLEVKAQDSVGNWSQVRSYTWIRDITPPKLTEITNIDL